MPPKAKGKKAARKMPPPMPTGEVLTDGIKREEWVLGPSIGKGGFGEIYLASRRGTKSPADHVIKIEPFENGPLFSELSYYRRAAKEEAINEWIKKHRLKYLGVPKYITSGRHTFNGSEYRFMVMQRFGDDLEKHFRRVGVFCEDTVCYLALQLLESLHYLHESEYVHADIKGSNLLTGCGKEEAHVYLVDYGLAYRFNPGDKHVEYNPDPRRAHDGTVEFTSIDAHNGANPSRRGDLEILGYCLLQWSCGELPWEDRLDDKNYVANQKKSYKKNPAKLIQDCFGISNPPQFLEKYMTEVYKLTYIEKPDYNKLKTLFTNQLKNRDPTKSLEWLSSVQSRKRPPSEDVDERSYKDSVPVKKRRVAPREEDKVHKRGVRIPLLKTKPRRVPRGVAVEESESDDFYSAEDCEPKPKKKRGRSSKPGKSSNADEVDGVTKPKRRAKPVVLGVGNREDGRRKYTDFNFTEIIPGVDMDAMARGAAKQKRGAKPPVLFVPGVGNREDGGRRQKPPPSKPKDIIPGISNPIPELLCVKASTNASDLTKSPALASDLTKSGPSVRRSKRTKKEVNYKDLESSFEGPIYSTDSGIGPSHSKRKKTKRA